MAPSTSSGLPPSWHALAAREVAAGLDVDPSFGLPSSEAARRLAEYGPNRLAEAPREPAWRAFLRQFQDLLIVILLIAAAVSLVVSREWETPVAIVVVVLLNATIGYVQESRAEAALDALRQMTVTTATVRRDGRLVRLDAEELVPGDVVVLAAGDRVPADGRLFASSSLEVQESVLTGEALAVAKSADAAVGAEVLLADRVTAVYMNTAVTRGRGEVLVTDTGMAGETGRIADLLHKAQPGPTPLQRQIDALSRTLAWVSGVVIVAVFVLGLVRGQDFGDLFVSAVSLAVAAIPEGLPAVVAFTLAMGTGRMAKRGAIVKRLASVETLGSTSQICTDKTGTLTLNQMTARELLLAGRRFTVSGEGYSVDGRIRTTDGSPVPATMDDALTAMALCSDAVIRDGQVVGDPTEGALVVLAEKAGIDVARLRQERPRRLEIPFDSAYKFMATFHDWTDDTGREVIRCFVKGAPDVLADRADRYLGGETVLPFEQQERQRYEQANSALAGQGMRVLALGAEDFPAEGFQAPADPKKLLDRVVLLALVGIVDPPRPEARTAIAECRDAGVRVRMITGDHAITAGAIAGELGIPGQAITGAELDRIDDDALPGRLDEVGVVARVSPEHKIRIVRALQARGDVVAMTGDGVNDAPALRRADIGVAMGVTGTEVTKEASTMVLTDDNFATIVAAVREGRGIYDNIVKFVRFQVSTALGFVTTFLVSSLTGLAGGAPFTALQILFVNLVMDGPPAMSLGVDPVSPDAMSKPPRPTGEPILNRTRLARILLTSAVMAAGTLAVLTWGPGPESEPGQATVAGTMAFVTFVFFQVYNLLNVRHDTHSVFSRRTLENPSMFVAGAVVIVLLVLIVEMDALHGFFTTTNLTSSQWLVCAAVGSTILWTGELVKTVLRSRTRRPTRARTMQPQPSRTQ
ncbi:cation-translocating P-type ATPase [Streptomyces scabiei]|uniref:Cation-translocating P-type ATPase n=1 Tax=Streptomyces niveiscabiei TaxID=164115 RepID=A0ABW9HXY4_9ACTN|nr:HAD-IC family P-type ATPase [Streptomyces europaeiscabiei]MDX3866476.1 HAD-IC family P-type ATPase [Streptomyces europaeiscabiei]MDX3874471.1 HAD-IC family P-type ATPase [Streptomyces europaeiscabiei]